MMAVMGEAGVCARGENARRAGSRLVGGAGVEVEGGAEAVRAMERLWARWSVPRYR